MDKINQSEKNVVKNESKMSSRERVMAALKRKPVDYVPCSPFLNSLMPEQRMGSKYQFPFGDSQQEKIEYCCNVLGTDPFVSININPYYPNKDVTVQKYLQNNEIHKKFITPSGELYAIVKYDEGWPFGFDIPLYHDFTSYYIKPWISTYSDIECLKHVLCPLWSNNQMEDLKFNFMKNKKLADKFGLATMTSIGLGLTGALQMFLPTELCYKVIDEPETVDYYLELEHKVNLKHMEIMLELGIDVIRRNGFYETADYYSPAMLRQFLEKRLKNEIKIVHEAEKIICYTAHTGITPIIENLKDLDFDCIMHVDIAHRSNDIYKMRDELFTNKSIITGPSNTYHMWSNDVNVVKESVAKTFEVFGKEGLLISASSSAHSTMPWENTLAMIDEWKKLR